MPEYGLPVNTIYHADCFDGMSNLPPCSVDFILSDPPYGITNNVWDTPVDLDRLWTEYKRIIRPGGVIALTAQCPFDKKLGMSNRAWLRYEWIWEKSRPTGFLNSRRMPLRAHETVLVFYEKGPKYRPQFMAGKPYRSKRAATFIRHLGRQSRATVTDNPGLRYPRTVLHIPSEAQPLHPTQKPVALFEYLILTYTDPGDLVLDTFMGAGTTAIACLNSRRDYLGFERDPGFHAAAQRRITLHKSRLQGRSSKDP